MSLPWHINESITYHYIIQNIRNNPGNLPVLFNVFPKLTEQIIKKDSQQLLQPNDWDFICKKYQLTHKFIDTFARYLNWNLLCYFQKLSLDLIMKHHDYIFDAEQCLSYQ